MEKSWIRGGHVPSGRNIARQDYPEFEADNRGFGKDEMFEQCESRKDERHENLDANIPDPREKICEEAIVYPINYVRRREKYFAKNRVIPCARKHKKFIDYKAIDMYLGNEIVAEGYRRGRERWKCD